MTITQDRPKEKPKINDNITNEDDFCHIAKGEVPDGGYLTWCGIVIDEDYCCNPEIGHPFCKRPRCPDCHKKWEERNG